MEPSELAKHIMQTKYLDKQLTDAMRDHRDCLDKWTAFALMRVRVRVMKKRLLKQAGFIIE